MAHVLVLTREPNDPFTYNTGVRDNPKKMQFTLEQGRYGTLVLLKAGQITGVHLVKGNEPGGAGSVTVPGGRLEIACSGVLEEVARYMTIERTDHNMVMMPPRRSDPYFVTWEPNNRVVRELGRTKGHCFRIHGGKTLAQQGILIHAAPHVGWLTGCISPRKDGDRHLPTDTTYWAIDDLYRRIGNHRADFFITDW